MIFKARRSLAALIGLCLPTLAFGSSATTTAISISPSPSIFGASITITTTVTPGAATGKVTFYDGSTILGVRALSSGIASLQTSQLPAGSRSIWAVYLGSSVYSSSTSARMTHLVNAQSATSFESAVNYSVGADPGGTP